MMMLANQGFKRALSMIDFFTVTRYVDIVDFQYQNQPILICGRGITILGLLYCAECTHDTCNNFKAFTNENKHNKIF